MGIVEVQQVALCCLRAFYILLITPDRNSSYHTTLVNIKATNETITYATTKDRNEKRQDTMEVLAWERNSTLVRTTPTLSTAKTRYEQLAQALNTDTMSIADTHSVELTDSIIDLMKAQIGYIDSHIKARKWYDRLCNKDKLLVFTWLVENWQSERAYGWERPPLELAHVEVGEWPEDMPYNHG